MAPVSQKTSTKKSCPLRKRLLDMRGSLLGLHKALIRPSEDGDGFERSYYEALQREPDVIFAHVEVKKLLTKIAA